MAQPTHFFINELARTLRHLAQLYSFDQRVIALGIHRSRTPCHRRGVSVHISRYAEDNRRAVRSLYKSAHIFGFQAPVQTASGSGIRAGGVTSPLICSSACGRLVSNRSG